MESIEFLKHTAQKELYFPSSPVTKRMFLGETEKCGRIINIKSVSLASKINQTILIQYYLQVLAKKLQCCCRQAVR